MAVNAWRLPEDVADQSYVSVSAIPVGSLYLPDKEVFEDCVNQGSGELEGTGRRVPSFAYLVQHEKHGRLLFDLGLRKHGQGYPPDLQRHLHEFWIKCKKDIVDLLEVGGLRPSDIDAVIYSHLHFDHVGDISPFASALLVVGRDAEEILASTYPQNPESHVHQLPPGQKMRYVNFTTDGSATLGPFPRAIDYFHDGSFYLIDALGHYPGHLIALARIGPNQFVLLAADCCHHRLCFNPGERLVSHENHQDIDAARQTVERVKAMHREKNVIVLLAHDEGLEEELGQTHLYPSSLNEWAMHEIEHKERRA